MAEMSARLGEPILVDPPSRDLQRRAAALARWRKRSGQVRFFRRALPAAIAAIFVFGLGWVAVRALVAIFGDAGRNVGAIHLINPVFYGRNSRGQPYVMAASEAVRDGGDPDRIVLTDPDLKQATGNPEPQTVHALHGVYHEQDKLLDLAGHVVATDGKGYRFLSSFAHVDMRRNAVAGDVHCSADGPGGSITADAYRFFDKGQHAVFTGHVFNRLITAKTAGAGPGVAPTTPAKALTPAAVPPMQPSVITPAPR